MLEYYLPDLKDRLKAKGANRSLPEMTAALKQAKFDVDAALKSLLSAGMGTLSNGGLVS